MPEKNTLLTGIGSGILKGAEMFFNQRTAEEAQQRQFKQQQDALTAMKILEAKQQEDQLKLSSQMSFDNAKKISDLEKPYLFAEDEQGGIHELQKGGANAKGTDISKGSASAGGGANKAVTKDVVLPLNTRLAIKKVMETLISGNTPEFSEWDLKDSNMALEYLKRKNMPTSGWIYDNYFKDIIEKGYNPTHSSYFNKAGAQNAYPTSPYAAKAQMGAAEVPQTVFTKTTKGAGGTTDTVSADQNNQGALDFGGMTDAEFDAIWNKHILGK